MQGHPGTLDSSSDRFRGPQGKYRLLLACFGLKPFVLSSERASEETNFNVRDSKTRTTERRELSSDFGYERIQNKERMQLPEESLHKTLLRMLRQRSTLQ